MLNWWKITAVKVKGQKCRKESAAELPLTIRWSLQPAGSGSRNTTLVDTGIEYVPAAAKSTLENSGGDERSSVAQIDVTRLESEPEMLEDLRSNEILPAEDKPTSNVPLDDLVSSTLLASVTPVNGESVNIPFAHQAIQYHIRQLLFHDKQYRQFIGIERNLKPLYTYTSVLFKWALTEMSSGKFKDMEDTMRQRSKKPTEVGQPHGARGLNLECQHRCNIVMVESERRYANLVLACKTKITHEKLVQGCTNYQVGSPTKGRPTWEEAKMRNE
ncbi:hypothetical protein C8R48DRAFT_680390 [Suillus tomentosus]|nr:hypothetical protein C8R48DRAFT_680390 [Suillus tomentosus]